MRFRALLFLGAAWSVAPGLGAQDVPLARLFPNLLTRSVITPSSSGVAGTPHEGHFYPALAQQSAAYDLNKSLVTYLSTFPLGSSSGGFTYASDSATGIPSRSSSNFGPAFAERALTIGKGRLSAGVNFQSVGYDRFEGLDLGQEGRGGELVFFLQHNDCCLGQTAAGEPGPAPRATDPGAPFPGKDPAFESDLLRIDLAFEVKNRTTALFANYGLTDRLDLGLAIPIVTIDVKADVFASIERVSGSSPLIHTFEGNQDVSSRRFSDQGSATGLGDVALRAKYNFLHRKGGGLAMALDLRLPTGDKDQLLGTGATQGKLSLLYSGDYGRFSPHLNLGYTYSRGDVSDAVRLDPAEERSRAALGGVSLDPDLSVPDEINYTGGFTFALSPRATLTFDAVGRTIRDANRFGLTQQEFQFRTRNYKVNGVVQETLSTTSREAVAIVENGNLNIVLGAAGLKLNLSRTLLLNAQVLFPITDAGLRAKVTPVIGLDYAF